MVPALLVLAFLAVPATTAADEVANRATYDDTMRFLDRRARGLGSERARYWSGLDHRSVRHYRRSLTRYRRDLRRFLPVPRSCLRGRRPAIVSDMPVRRLGRVVVRRVHLKVCAGSLSLHGLLALPDGVSRPPLMMAIHGTAGSPEAVLGMTPDDYHHAFGLRLTEQGIAVFAPQIVTSTGGPDVNVLRNHLDNRGTSLGVRLLGLEAGKLISVVDGFSADRRFDGSRIGVYGISLGGVLALYSAAADARLGPVVVSQYLENRTGKLLGRSYPMAYWKVHNADYIFSPGLLQRYTDERLAALLLPRRLIIEVGTRDPRAWPTEARLAPSIRRQYRRLGLSPRRLSVIVGPGEHETFPSMTVPTVQRALGERGRRRP